MKEGLGPGHIVLDGDPAPPKGAQPIPQVLAHVHCGQMAGWSKMPLCMEVGLCPGDFVLDGDPTAPSPSLQKRGTAPPQFLAYVYSGQTAGEIKVPLGRKVGLGLGDIVLDGA